MVFYPCSWMLIDKKECSWYTHEKECDVQKGRCESNGKSNHNHDHTHGEWLRESPCGVSQVYGAELQYSSIEEVKSDIRC
jgi:hypothetical protein